MMSEDEVKHTENVDELEWLGAAAEGPAVVGKWTYDLPHRLRMRSVALAIASSLQPRFPNH